MEKGWRLVERVKRKEKTLRYLFKSFFHFVFISSTCSTRHWSFYLVYKSFNNIAHNDVVPECMNPPRCWPFPGQPSSGGGGGRSIGGQNQRIGDDRSSAHFPARNGRNDDSVSSYGYPQRRTLSHRPIESNLVKPLMPVGWKEWLYHLAYPLLG